MNSKFIFSHNTVLFFVLAIQIFAEKNHTIGRETLSFNDGSSLIGKLQEAEKEGNLVWLHRDSKNPLIFGYHAVESVIFNRVVAVDNQEPAGKLRVKFVNQDFLRGTLISLDNKELVFKTRFNQTLRADLSDLSSIEFLPPSYKNFYDSSLDFKKWKKSNSKAWTEEKGSLISVFSGSTGTILPEVDALEVSFDATWQRSFYLALRLFSDSDGGSYGSEGYHLSFSNNRINLQSNRKIKGRTVRETLGSVMVDQLVGVKKAKFKISAHRQRKEFVVLVNGIEVARFKDSNSEDNQPQNSGLLLINQGGNSYLRLEELTIAGWSGESFSNSPNPLEGQNRNQVAYFQNGDSTPVNSTSSTTTGLRLETKRGTFEVPFENLRSLYFSAEDTNETTDISSEQVSLKNSLGKLSFELDSIKGGILGGKHSLLGSFKIPVHEIKRLQCNLLLKSYREYLSQLRLAEEELKSQNSEKALSILENMNSHFRCWYWKRLRFLADDFNAKEILWFSPHPEVGILKASLNEQEENTIFTTSKTGSFALWDEYAKLAEGNYTHQDSTSQEVGRSKNEKWKKIYMTNRYWLGTTEVTQKQFEKITGTNPSKKKGPNLPVQVNWLEAMEFCKLMNQKFAPPSGLTWRLPTEAEWEYAARAGSTAPYCNTYYGKFPNDQDTYKTHLKLHGWFSENSSGEVKAVSQKLPNDWGLFDMHGNVWEWCMDGTSVNKTELFSFPRAGAKNPARLDGDWKILKGGSFITDYSRCRSSYRGANSPTVSEGDRGLRICLGQALPSNESNTSKIETQEENLHKQVQEFSPISLERIDPGEFMMGSRDSINFPQAICDLKDKTILSTDSSSKFASRKLSSLKPEWEIDLNGTGLVIVPLVTEKRLLIGTETGEIHIVDRKTRRIVNSYNDHDAPIVSIAVDKQEQCFVSCGLGGKVVLRKIAKEKPQWIITTQDYSHDIEYLEFSNDSKSILASGFLSNVMVIDTPSGKIKTVWRNKDGTVLKAKWLPENNYLSILHANGILSFIEAKSGVVFQVLRTNLPSTFDFEFSKNGKKILLVTYKGSCSLRQLPDYNSILITSPDGIIERTPDFYFNLSKNKDKNYPKLNEFLLEYELNPDLNQSTAVTASPCNKQIATTHDGALRIWSSQTGDLIATLAEKLSSDFTSCSFSKDGTILMGKLESGHKLFYPTERAVISDSPEEAKSKIKSGFPHFTR
jgi:formylglycine-generating enzyme required for sulfatase activity